MIWTPNEERSGVETKRARTAAEGRSAPLRATGSLWKPDVATFWRGRVLHTVCAFAAFHCLKKARCDALGKFKTMDIEVNEEAKKINTELHI